MGTTDELLKKFQDQESKFSHLQRYLEDRVRNEIDSLKMSQDTFRQVSPKRVGGGGGGSVSDMSALEEKVNKRIADSIE